MTTLAKILMLLVEASIRLPGPVSLQYFTSMDVRLFPLGISRGLKDVFCATGGVSISLTLPVLL